MKRIGFLTGLICIALTSALGQDRELAETASKLAQQISQSGKKSIAIGNLTNSQNYGPQFSDYVVDGLGTLLAGSGKGFEVVTRTRLTQISHERDLKFGRDFDAAVFQQLGKFAGAEAIIGGSYRVLGSVINVNLQILDVSRGTIIAGVLCTIPRTKDVEEILGVQGASRPPESQEAARIKPLGSPQFQLPLLESFRPTETISFMERGYVGTTVSPYKCKNTPESIMCYLLVTRKREWNEEYTASIGNVRFFDNLNIEHQEIHSYYVNGKGQPQKSVNLGQGDTAWIVHEFAGGSSQITSGRIIYIAVSQQLHLHVE